MNSSSSRSVFLGLLRQFIYLIILVLIVVGFWKVGDAFKSATVQEYGIFESAQSIVLLLIALSFLLQAAFNPRYRSLLSSMGLLALTALVREQDAYFDELVPLIGWGWCWLFPLAGLGILLRDQRQLGATLLPFLRSNAFHMMMTAVVIIIPVAQCLGHRSFLADLMGDAHLNAFLMRRILEEPIELLGYIQIRLASLECLFEMRGGGKA